MTPEEHDHVQQLEGDVKRYRGRIVALKEQVEAQDQLLKVLATRVNAKDEELLKANEKVEALRAEATRALIRGTVKGYTAGENTDSKHWRQRAEAAEHALNTCEIHTDVEGIQHRTACAVCLTEALERLHNEGIEHSECQEALIKAQARLTELERELADERDVSLNDPAEQRAERYAEECRDLAAKLQLLINVMDERGQLPEHVFTFPDGDTWEAQPWPR